MINTIKSTYFNPFYNSVQMLQKYGFIIGKPRDREWSSAPENMVFIRSCTCPIDLTEFSDDDLKLGCVFCKNIFKKNNLERWLRKHNTCPLCRRNARFCLVSKITVP